MFEKIRQAQTGILLYGITPPKLETPVEKLREIAAGQIERLAPLQIDGLIVYDIQDESSRTAEERPFPFTQMVSPLDYCEHYLQDLAIPKIAYAAVSGQSTASLQGVLERTKRLNLANVFVGAASKGQVVSMTMDQAYGLRSTMLEPPLLGGVTIPERHMAKGNEHQRLIQKIQQGSSFFVSQGVYDVNASLNLLSDYYYLARDLGVPLKPIIFTLTPCGSPKTLAFMKWLGISVPAWLERDLVNAQDILQTSVEISALHWRKLKHFAQEKGIPIGCNIESVSIRKAEIDASIELLQRVIGCNE